MSKDPVINEKGLVEMLDCKVQVDNTSRLQAGAMMSLVDGFDRKINREEYLKLLLASFSMYAQLAKLYLLGEVRESFRIHSTDSQYDPDVFATLLRTTQDDIHKLAIDVHAEVKKRTDLIVQCPTSVDKVH